MKRRRSGRLSAEGSGGDGVGVRSSNRKKKKQKRTTKSAGRDIVAAAATRNNRSTKTSLSLPLPEGIVNAIICKYLNDPDGVRAFRLVSKEFCATIRRIEDDNRRRQQQQDEEEQPISNEILPFFRELHIRPLKDNDYNFLRIEKLVQQLWKNRQKLQEHQKLTIFDINRFTNPPSWYKIDRILERWPRRCKLNGIFSLNFGHTNSSNNDDGGHDNKVYHGSHTDVDWRAGEVMRYPYVDPSDAAYDTILLRVLAPIVPNVKVLDLGTIPVQHLPIHTMFETKFTGVEKLIFGGTIGPARVEVRANGDFLENLTNLRELNLDGFHFHYRLGTWFDPAVVGSGLQDGFRRSFADLDNTEDQGMFFLHRCSAKLKRVSVKDIRWQRFLQEMEDPEGNAGYTFEIEPFPQSALIKFVRRVPTLRWFSSDLTQENIDMLKAERPEIEFV